MSQSTDALEDGLDLSLVEHGQTFEVDGVEGEITGVIEDTTDQLTTAMGGVESGSEITVIIARDVWTPEHGAVVTFDEETYTVNRINDKTPHKWTFSATSR